MSFCYLGKNRFSWLFAGRRPVYGFWRPFSKVVMRIEAAKPDADFSLQPLRKRVWDFFWEVLCQAKVIRERPLPGLAHAFVFWGFCVFALVTAESFRHRRSDSRCSTTCSARRTRNSRPDSESLVAMAIAGLFVRRFFVRPQWLGELSKESGVIALLIFALMVTFILAVVFAAASEKAAVVGAHARAAGVHAADPPHQASAPGAQPA